MTLNPIIKFGKEYSHTAAYRPLANFNTHTNTHTHTNKLNEDLTYLRYCISKYLWDNKTNS